MISCIWPSFHFSLSYSSKLETREIKKKISAPCRFQKRNLNLHAVVGSDGFFSYSLFFFLFLSKYNGVIYHFFVVILFIFNLFSNLILFLVPSLNIWFQIIFISNLVHILLIVIYFVLDLFLLFFSISSLIILMIWNFTLLFLGFAFYGVSLGLMTKVTGFEV
jgi:hypothetical protein